MKYLFTMSAIFISLGVWADPIIKEISASVDSIVAVGSCAIEKDTSYAADIRVTLDYKVCEEVVSAQFRKGERVFLNYSFGSKDIEIPYTRATSYHLADKKISFKKAKPFMRSNISSDYAQNNIIRSQLLKECTAEKRLLETSMISILQSRCQEE
jgi:hypothetical protein